MPKRPLLVVLVGLPGAGKSTWCRENNLPAVSSDDVRELLTGDAANQAVNRVVFPTLRRMIEARLRAGAQVTYIDSTALSHSERRAWVRFAELHDCDIEAVFFNTPLEVCRRRNQARRRIVPAEAMDRLARKLTPPRLEEGFRKVTLISAPNP